MILPPNRGLKSVAVIGVRSVYGPVNPKSRPGRIVTRNPQLAAIAGVTLVYDTIMQVRSTMKEVSMRSADFDKLVEVVNNPKGIKNVIRVFNSIKIYVYDKGMIDRLPTKTLEEEKLLSQQKFKILEWDKPSLAQVQMSGGFRALKKDKKNQDNT